MAEPEKVERASRRDAKGDLVRCARAFQAEAPYRPQRRWGLAPMALRFGMGAIGGNILCHGSFNAAWWRCWPRVDGNVFTHNSRSQRKISVRRPSFRNGKLPLRIASYMLVRVAPETRTALGTGYAITSLCIVDPFRIQPHCAVTQGTISGILPPQRTTAE